MFQEILQAENLGAVSRSELCFYVSPAGDGAGAGQVPERFAFLTASGMYSGNIEYSNQNPGISVIDNFHLLPYFICNTDSSYPENLPGIPISMALTEFHLILAYRDRVVAVCQLNDQLVYEEATAKVTLRPNQAGRSISSPDNGPYKTHFVATHRYGLL